MKPNEVIESYLEIPCQIDLDAGSEYAQSFLTGTARQKEEFFEICQEIDFDDDKLAMIELAMKLIMTADAIGEFRRSINYHFKEKLAHDVDDAIDAAEYEEIVA